MQLVMAGSDTEGLRYGMIETNGEVLAHAGRKEALPAADENPLTSRIGPALPQEPAFWRLIHDFIVFDAGTKKPCRHNQYFGVRAAQEHVQRREGGIIWHTQGCGKSLTMVWLAKWIRENVTDARVLIITDRTELDEQIEKVFNGVSEDIYRTTSGARPDRQAAQHGRPVADLLADPQVRPRGRGLSDKRRSRPTSSRDQGQPAQGFHAKGDIFVFVDECHRTQSGELHEAMKAILPEAMFIGFTGTPLLKADKQKSIEVFRPLHPHLQVRRGGAATAWCSTCATRRATSTRTSPRRPRSTSGSRPRRRA